MTGPEFPANAFAGTAGYYARHRAPYPHSLLTDLLGRARISGTGRLLDLACGPGRLTLPLAPSFRDAVGLDLEPEMLATAREEAVRLGVRNVAWILRRAEDFASPSSSFELITIGAAFHRLDQPRVAGQTLRWLQPGGHLAIAGDYGILDGRDSWQMTVAEIVRKWTGRPAPAPGVAAPPASRPEHHEQVMREAGFVDVANHAFVQRREWKVGDIIGYLYSTSFASRRVLGDKAPRMEEELRSALGADATFSEDARCGYSLGRKPA